MKDRSIHRAIYCIPEALAIAKHSQVTLSHLDDVGATTPFVSDDVSSPIFIFPVS
jgi:hypothetical protein